QEEAGTSGTERTQPSTGLRLYPFLQVTMVQKTKKMRSMSHLPFSYIVPQGP
ncbi:hypothetical protein ILYODFUR_029559, partial [Ilyodon furcidens]